MPAWLAESISRLPDTPWLQALLAALATFVLEDATTASCGLFVADGRMSFVTALIGVAAGIAIGDIGLYLIGRLLGPAAISLAGLSHDRTQRVNRWFDRNLYLAVGAARFIPGTRLPTYLGAGAFRASFPRFVIVAIAASIIWSLLLLTIVSQIGESVLPVLGRAKWPVGIGFVALLVLVEHRVGKRMRKDKPRQDSNSAPVASVFEFWPPWLFYIPVVAYYVWLSIRHRGLTLPTAANPSIYSGGLIRESKSQILGLVPETQSQWFAPFILVERGLGPACDLVALATQMLSNKGITYPIVAKPDLGQRGAGVQRIVDDSALLNYFHQFPKNCAIILQELVPYPHEAGVLYCRIPGEPEGQVFSVTLKEFPVVFGDGNRTLQALIDADPRASLVRQTYMKRHAERLGWVPDQGERVELVFAGNHAQGAVFRDGTALATPELRVWLEAIASSIPDFYFGRFDIRYRSLDAFLQGRDGCIVEINGAGAEATHIWDPAMRLSEAYRTLFRQFELLFEIGAANRRMGHRPLSVVQVLRDWRYYMKTSRKYPLSH
ncbi:MAG: hypothetical protein AMXMBFR84_31880 [Candidatus Hydrogenedentota bacterium]